MQDDANDFLLRVAELLHQHGTPSHRLERLMGEFARVMGVEANFLYTPTALHVAFAKPVPHTRLVRVEPGGTDLGKLYEFDSALEDLEAGKCTVADCRRRFEEISSSGPRYHWSLTFLSMMAASAVGTVLFRGGWREVAMATILGGMVFVLEKAITHLRRGNHMLEAMAGFMVAALALVLSATVFPVDDRLVTMGALIVLFPGFSFTVAMVELATKHLSSGVARLAGAGVAFLTLAVGVGLAWRMGQDFRIAAVEVVPLDWQWEFVALAVAPFAFAILLKARVRQWMLICFVAWSGFLIARMGTIEYGVEYGAFAGALVIGVLSNLYARIRNHPAMIPQVPAILILVPGSIGFRSVTAFIDRNAIAGIEFAFSMFMIAIAIVGGLLAANALMPPRRML